MIGVAVVGLVSFGSEARVRCRGWERWRWASGATATAWKVWYQNDYAASQAGRAVALRANLVHETAQPDEDVVRATVSYEAVSGKSLSVVGSAYTLTALGSVRCERRERAEVPQVLRCSAASCPILSEAGSPRTSASSSRARSFRRGEVVADGRPWPRSPRPADEVFHVRRGRYQLLRSRAAVRAISARRPVSADSA